MKKLMTAMLGLSMLLGTATLFAADKDTTKSTAKSKSKSRTGKKRSKDKMTTSKS